MPTETFRPHRSEKKNPPIHNLRGPSCPVVHGFIRQRKSHALTQIPNRRILANGRRNTPCIPLELPARTPAHLPNSLDNRLTTYALAACAAGVGILALSPPAEAKIVYTPVHRVIGPHQSFKIDLNHDNIADFTISNFGYCGTDQCFYALWQKPAAGNRAMGFLFDGQLLLESALQPGVRIGPPVNSRREKAHWSKRSSAPATCRPPSLDAGQTSRIAILDLNSRSTARFTTDGLA
jgi:hypothetical protein